MTNVTTLYIAQQGCHVSLQKEHVIVKQGQTHLQALQLPLLEQILVFGQSHLTTPLIRACLQRDIPIAYLSRMGRCYGRLIAIERGYRHLARHQQELVLSDRILTARRIIQAKLHNSRVLLQRQQRRRPNPALVSTLRSLSYLNRRAAQATSTEQLMGFEGAAAACYFAALGQCLTNSSFQLIDRNRRPPKDPVNAMLSFGYQVLWNHLLTLIELQGLDPYIGCLHQGNERHAALASDLIEEFRAPIVDSLVLQLINQRMINADHDFVYRDGGCYLNDTGRPKYLKAFLQRMEDPIQIGKITQPRWDLLNQQVKAYKQFIYSPSTGYQPYKIR